MDELVLKCSTISSWVSPSLNWLSDFELFGGLSVVAHTSSIIWE